MDVRRKTILFVLGYATFIVVATQTFIPQGYEQLATESASSKIIENICFFLAYLLIAAILLPRRIRQIPLPYAMMSLAGIFCSQIVFFFHNHGLAALSPFAIISFHVTTGISFAILFSFWAGMAYVLDGRSFRFCILAGSLLASFAVIFINAVQSPLVVLASKCVALTLSALLILLLAKASKGGIRGREREQTRRPGQEGDKNKHKVLASLKGLVVPMVCTGILGFAYQYSWTIVSPNDLASMFFAIGEAFAVSIIFLIAAMPESRSFNIAGVFRFLCPITGLSVFLLYFTQDVLQLLLMGVVSASFNLCLILLMPLCATIGKKRGMSVSGLYALAAGPINMFPTLGYVIGSAPLQQTTASVYIIALVFFFILLLIALFANKKDCAFDIALSETQALAAFAQEETTATVVGRSFIAMLISEEYGLTQREEEVLRMILLGRDAPAISEELCISKNTVKTHVKKIYQKIDLHSRQELADLIEDFENSIRSRVAAYEEN